VRRALLAITASAGLLLAGHSTASAATESADVYGQDGSVYAAGGARLVRQADGISASVTMPTPAPGSYVYPAGTESGHPEVFTLWAFVFNHPEHCTGGPGGCGPDDLANPAVEFGVYNVAGHVASGASMTLSGRVGVGEPAGAPPGITPHNLSNPAGAAVHLAVTSHGGLDPATLPGEFHRPTGSPSCGCWWTAFFG
jgi:hypothetical protein